MKNLLYFEWLHFSRNPARPLAVLFFIVAAIFGLKNGQELYNERVIQLASFNSKSTESQQKVLSWLEGNVAGPEDRPWVNVSTPFWAMWYANHHLSDTPNPLMIFSIGQAELFGYSKKISVWSSAYDNDLTSELSNPEHVQLGALDFTFVWLYLMPLLLIIFTYSIGGLEKDLSFITLVKVQVENQSAWLAARFIVIGLALTILLSICIASTFLASNNLALDKSLFLLFIIYEAYLMFWLIMLYIIVLFGKSQADQAIKMIGLWILLAVVIPGSVSQITQIKAPVDYMLHVIEAQRDGEKEIYTKPYDSIMIEAYKVIPALKNTQAALYDSLRDEMQKNALYRLMYNYEVNNACKIALDKQLNRNVLIQKLNWFSPVVAFHNRINELAETDQKSHLAYRQSIQSAVMAINIALIIDEWNGVKVDKKVFTEYVNIVK